MSIIIIIINNINMKRSRESIRAQRLTSLEEKQVLLRLSCTHSLIRTLAPIPARISYMFVHELILHQQSVIIIRVMLTSAQGTS
jgi:hypothetical protein